MGATSGRSILYGDVALIGVGVFVAVALVLAALGGPAAANSGHAGAAHGTAATDGGDAAPTALAAEDTTASAPTPASGDAAAAGDDEHAHGDDHTQGGDADPAPRREARPAAPTSSGTPPRTTTTASSDHGDGGHQTHTDGGGTHAHGGDDHAEGHDDQAEGQAQGADDHAEGHDDHAEGHDAQGGGDDSHADDHDDHAEGHDAQGQEHEADEHAHGSDESDEHDADGGHPTGSHGDHAAGCDENHPAAQKLLAEVQHSLDYIYPNIATMIAHGFIPYFDAIIPLGAATEGTGHWLNPEYIDNGVQLDATRPEGILTDQLHNPLGIMFIADADGYEKPVYVDEDGTECSPWHPHTDTPATFSWFFYELTFDGKWMDGDVEWQPETPAMLHVWAVDNPHGVFAAHDYPEASERPGLSLERQLPLPPPAPFGDVLPTIDETVLGPISEQTCPHC